MRLRYALEADEAAIDAATRALGWRLLTVRPDPRRLVYGAGDWQASFTVGLHVDLSGHDPESLASTLAVELPLGPAEPAPEPRPEPLARPRLADGVEPRLHVGDGPTRVLLRERRREAHRWIDVALWDVLARADGTRDRDALETRGVGPGLDSLEAEGWLADGLPAGGLNPVEPPRAADRPLEVFGDLTLRCDGSGGCCHAYGAVPFRREEAARARALFTDVRFTPWRAGDSVHEAPMLVHDRCAFLDGDDRCRLHPSGAKPFGCSLYPATLVDDGVSLRVSVAPECACVFESVGATDGAPLWPEDASRPAREAARPLPDPVPITTDRAVPRAKYRPWADGLLAQLGERDDDLAAWLLGVARAMGEAPLPLLTSTRVDPTLPPMRALPTVADPTRSVRSSEVLRWAEAARASITTWPAPRAAAHERVYLRALTFGHRLAVEATPLADALRERAARLVLARAMHDVDAPSATLAAHPLGALEATLRHRGLRLTPAR